ncbi:MAG TPA: hypothetical protein VJ792_09910 [Candidatus Nitrosotalea sp.]|nr:hypothetical protein [Candidatus Nitrosotalea sp.]
MASYSSLDVLCSTILKINKNIQSVSIINKMGRLIEDASRPNFTRKFPEQISEHFLMQCVLQISMGRDFDEYYGPINYHISERAGLTMLTFPIDGNVLLVLCNKNLSPIMLAKRVVCSIDEYRKQASVIEL